ncbi:hypothetical protein GPALN_004837 [Globodera pallida]|nr:hypothetical protein GPALN_004837 [Globodera pallida]
MSITKSNGRTPNLDKLNPIQLIRKNKMKLLQIKILLKRSENMKAELKRAGIKNSYNHEIDETVTKELGLTFQTIYAWKRELGQTAPNEYAHSEQKELMKRYYKIKDKNPKFIDEDIAKMLNIGISSLHLYYLNSLRQTQKIGKDTQKKILEAFHELTEQNAPIEAPEGETKSECAVCLGNFEAGDKVRPLPPCEHIFHTECIELWLKKHNNCPLCRAEIFKISSGKVKPNVKEAPNAEARSNTENAAENNV